MSDHDEYVRLGIQLGLVVWLGSVLAWELGLRLYDWLRPAPAAKGDRS